MKKQFLYDLESKDERQDFLDRWNSLIYLVEISDDLKTFEPGYTGIQVNDLLVCFRLKADRSTGAVLLEQINQQVYSS